jgi:hypothetical protein
VPYLLNPAGIVVLVTLSAEAGSIAVLAAAVGLLAVVLALEPRATRLKCRSLANRNLLAADGEQVAARLPTAD